jgi:hypothetical protein
MGLLNRLQILLRNIKRRRNGISPPSHEDWSALPEFVKMQIFYAAFDASQGIERKIYLAHWVGGRSP